MNRAPTDAEAVRDTGSERFDDHVSGRGEAQQQCAPIRVLEIETQPLHTAIASVGAGRSFDLTGASFFAAAAAVLALLSGLLSLLWFNRIL